MIKEHSFPNEWINICKTGIKKKLGKRPEITESVRIKVKERVEHNEENRDKTKTPKWDKEVITKEVKDSRIQDVMSNSSRTTGIKLGSKYLIQSMIEEISKKQPNVKDNIKRIMAIKLIVNHFAHQKLKFTSDEWSQVKVKHLFEGTIDNSDVIFIEFQYLDEISKFNAKLSNLDGSASEQIVQFVPPILFILIPTSVTLYL